MRTDSRFLVGVIFVAVAISALGANPGVEEVLSFHSDVLVEADGAITVVENITVRSVGISIRHGIYRYLPFLSDVTDVSRDNSQ